VKWRRYRLFKTSLIRCHRMVGNTPCNTETNLRKEKANKIFKWREYDDRVLEALLVF